MSAERKQAILDRIKTTGNAADLASCDLVIEAAAACRAAGIRVVMITGDSQAVADSVAAELGIDGDALLGEYVAELQQLLAGIRLVREISPRVKVKAIDFQGNEDIPTEQLLTALKDVGFAEGRVFSEKLRETSHAPVVYLEMPGAEHAWETVLRDPAATAR